jgi:hypothetical protein
VGLGSGAEVEQWVAALYMFRRGKILRVDAFWKLSSSGWLKSRGKANVTLDGCQFLIALSSEFSHSPN